VTRQHQKTGETISDFNDHCVVAIDQMSHTFTDVQKQQPTYQGHFAAMLYTFLASGLKEDIRSHTLGAVKPQRTDEALLTVAKLMESKMARARKTKQVLEIIAEQGDCSEPEHFPTMVQDLREIMSSLMTENVDKEAAAVGSDKSKWQAGTVVNANVTCFNCQG
jgi:hypothetical protein